MPARPARPCRHPCCSKLSRDGSGFCDAHQEDRHAGRFADRARGSRHERGYGSEWDKKRRLILQRDNGLCQPCLKGGRVSGATQVDHIIPKAEGGTDDDSNLQSICVPCHKAKTATEGGMKSPSGRARGPARDPDFHRREIQDKK